MAVSEVIVNYWAVLVAGVVSFIIGAIWYSPALFGKIWAKLQGVKMGSGKNVGILFIINFIAGLVTAYVLANTVKYAGAITFSDAIIVGFCIWLGYFAATTLLGSVLWENKPMKLFWINAGYWLVNICAMAVILTLWP